MLVCNHGYTERDEAVPERGAGMDQRWEPGRTADQAGLWVLLCYRVPREPSAPRIAIWRKLKRLGVGQLGDGLVGLPADARTREQLEWVAEEVAEAARDTGGAARAASLRRLRGELRRISRRDYFPPAARGRARVAVEALADAGDRADAVRADRAGGRP